MEIFAEEIKLRTILLNTCIHSIYFKKDGHSQDIKVNSFGLGFLSKVETSIGAFRNDLLYTTSPTTQTYSGINDTSLILEFGRDSKAITRASFNIEPNSGKIFKKLDFFELVSKSNFSLNVYLMQKI